MRQTDTQLVGVAGQYFVAAELSRLGIVATVTLRNTRGIDVLAANSTGTKAVSIQVKTNSGTKLDWILSEKAETVSAPDLFYVFVNLNGAGKSPTYYVVESSTVAKFAYEYHRTWISGSKKNGDARKVTTMRRFEDREQRYLEAWHRLGLGGKYIETQQSADIAPSFYGEDEIV